MDLTKRQRDLLKLIIKEFIATAEPVGSVTLSSKYDLQVSPATLRAEMAKLAENGYLYKEHSSSGRIPTTLGLRYFLDEMMNEEEINKLEETKLKEQLFQKRFNRALFMQEAVKALAQLTNQAAVSLVDDMVFIAGIGKLISEPEFGDISRLQDALDVMENESILHDIFQRYSTSHALRALIGDEIGLSPLNECGIVYSPFKFFRGSEGYLASFGPRRMKYGQVIPAVRSITSFIEEAIRGWE